MLLIVKLVEKLFRFAGVVRIVRFRELVEFAWKLRGGDGSLAL